MQAGAFTLITLANASSMKECAVNTDKLQGFHCLLKCVKRCFSEDRSNSVKMGVRMCVGECLSARNCYLLIVKQTIWCVTWCVMWVMWLWWWSRDFYSRAWDLMHIWPGPVSQFETWVCTHSLSSLRSPLLAAGPCGEKSSIIK